MIQSKIDDKTTYYYYSVVQCSLISGKRYVHKIKNK